MPSCTKCGTIVDRGLEKCPKCGASMLLPPIAAGGRGSSSGSSWRSSSGQLDYAPTRSKPMSATILTALAAIGGIDALLVAFGTNYIGQYTPALSIGNTLGLLSGSIPFYFMTVLGIVSLASAYAFFSGMNKAWTIGVVFSALNVLSILWSNYLGFAFGLITLYYLMRSHETKVWFHKN